MAIFLTGGSGFLGGQLISVLGKNEEVRALARSDTALAAVKARGAVGVRGDLDDLKEATEAMKGCRVLYHCAALAKDWGPRAEFLKANVDGVRNVLAAARAAGVNRVVHVSTEAIFATGKPLVKLNERTPRPKNPVGLYPETKGMSEDVVNEAVAAGQDVVIVRPRLIWGKGDTSLVPVLVKSVKDGDFAWVGGGKHLTSTCHVKNVIEGMRLAAEKGQKGAVYFLADEEGPTEFKGFITRMLTAAGAPPKEKTLPFSIAWMVATGAEMFARISGGHPMVTRTGLALSAVEVTVEIDRAQKELGFKSVISREAGLAELG